MYYINLDRRVDRWDECMERINTTCLVNFPYTRFSAFDGKYYENELKRFLEKDEYRDYINKIIEIIKETKIKKPNFAFKKGEFGCSISHLCVLIDILNNPDFKDDDYICIFEEDFYYAGSPENFNKSFLSLNETDLNKLDIDFLYVGGRFKPNFHAEGDFYEETDHINIFRRVAVTYSYESQRGAFSYIIRKKICEKLINIIINRFIKTDKNIIKLEPIDCIYQVLVDEIKIFDYFPHIFYSPANYKSDIQNNDYQR